MLQVLIHSYIYYELDDNIISDDTWKMWSLDIVENKHQPYFKELKYHEIFEDFDGSTGFHLAKQIDEDGREKALKLLRWCKK